MSRSIQTGVFVLFLALLLVAPNAHAESTTASTTTTNTAALMEQIKMLMAKVTELQKQLGSVRMELNNVIKDGIKEGSNDADIKKIQEVLATDPSIYPEGKVTGFFGPMTKEAIKRFQKRHDLEETGQVDEATKTLLEQYLSENQGGKIPEGLLRAPGIMKKVELRAKEGCDKKGEGLGVFCKKLKDKFEGEGEHSASGSPAMRMKPREDKMGTTSNGKDASHMIDEAKASIDEAQTHLEKSKDAGLDVARFNSLLNQANARLKDAEDARTANRLGVAYMQAKLAKKIGDRVCDELDKLNPETEDESEGSEDSGN